MIDYISTEIVVYSDNSPTFLQCYPLYIYGSDLTQIIDGVSITWTCKLISDQPITSGPLYDSYPDDKKDFLSLIHVYQVTHYDGVKLSSEQRVSIGPCYYVYAPDATPDHLIMYRLSLSDLPPGFNDPYGGTSTVDGDDIFWLYNLGHSLFSVASSSVRDILNFNIGGYNILYILSVNGFLVYMGWSIIKWVI